MNQLENFVASCNSCCLETFDKLQVLVVVGLIYNFKTHPFVSLVFRYSTLLGPDLGPRIYLNAALL